MEEEKKKKRVNAKRKGSNAERYYAIAFRELGFDKCLTARYASTLHDDTGIDLINLPINVQIKAGFQKGLNVSKTLADIRQRIETTFPQPHPENDYPLILIHKKQVKQGQKRTEEDEIVSMSFKDFTKLIQKIEKW